MKARELINKDVPADFPRLVRYMSKRDDLSAVFDVLQRLGTVTPRRVYLCPSLYILLPIDNKNDDMVILL